MTRLTYKLADQIAEAKGLPSAVVRAMVDREKDLVNGGDYRNSKLFELTYINGMQEYFTANQLPDVSKALRFSAEGELLPSFFRVLHPVAFTARADLVASVCEVTIRSFKVEGPQGGGDEVPGD